MMSTQQKHEIDVYLNALGGNGASKINASLGEIAANADRLPPSPERTAILDLTLQAHAVNNFDGRTLADFQQWNTAQPTDEPVPPVTPPVVIPPMPPAGSIVHKGDRFKCPVTEAPNSIQGQFDTAVNFSLAVADGKQCVISYSANPGEFIEGQAGGGNGGGVVRVPAGTHWLNWKLSPGMGGSTTGDVSIY